MSDDGETTLEVKGLDQLIKLMGKPAPVARVGILGSKAGARSSGSKTEPTNAEVGAFHEFGTETLPQRSFLRVPISEHLEKEMEGAGAFDEDVLRDAMTNATIIPYMKKIAILAEQIVLKAFDSKGYGKWPTSNMKYKQVKQTLVETQQLRNSITSEVKE